MPPKENAVATGCVFLTPLLPFEGAEQTPQLQGYVPTVNVTSSEYDQFVFKKKKKVHVRVSRHLVFFCSFDVADVFHGRLEHHRCGGIKLPSPIHRGPTLAAWKRYTRFAG